METPTSPSPATYEKVWEMFQETSRQLQEMRQQSQETDRKFRETDRRFEASRQDHDRIIQEMRQGWEQLRKQVSRLGDDIGHFVESMVEPSLIHLFAERGIILKDVAPRRRSCQPGAEMEVDLLAVDEDYAVVVEVKTRLKQSDVDEHLERLDLFKRAFPVYQDKQVLGAVAGMDVPDNVAKYAYRQGLFVLAQSGEVMEVLNDDQFQPRAW